LQSPCLKRFENLNDDVKLWSAGKSGTQRNNNWAAEQCQLFTRADPSIGCSACTNKTSGPRMLYWCSGASVRTIPSNVLWHHIGHADLVLRKIFSVNINV